MCVCGLTRWWNVNPCDRIILWGVPPCHLFNSMHCSSITAWNGPPKLWMLHSNFHTRMQKEESLSFPNTVTHFLTLALKSSMSLWHPPPCSFTPGVSSCNPSHLENRKLEKRKFRNKSLWHRQHLLAPRVHSSFRVRSMFHWRLQYVLSLQTFLITCETSLRDKWSTFPLESSH